MPFVLSSPPTEVTLKLATLKEQQLSPSTSDSVYFSFILLCSIDLISISSFLVNYLESLSSGQFVFLAINSAMKRISIQTDAIPDFLRPQRGLYAKKSLFYSLSPTWRAIISKSFRSYLIYMDLARVLTFKFVGLEER